jgi:predicted acetyltransferase
MVVKHNVTLELATERDATLLANLLEFYIHDLSAVFPVELGVEGRFGYDGLPLYWSQPDTRCAFLFRVNSRIAGFALVTRGSAATTDPHDLDLAEFFVLRSYRRSGIGRIAASLLFDHLPGHWVVRVSEANSAAVPFWESTISRYTRGAASKTLRPGKHHLFQVHAFTSADQGVDSRTAAHTVASVQP